MKDPGRKAYYKARAENLKLSNAYTAALTDYLRKGRVHSVNRCNYTGNAHQKIVVEIAKRGFSIKAVTVGLTTKAGVFIEEGSALQEIKDFWTYTTTEAVNDERDVVVSVPGFDTNGSILDFGNTDSKGTSFLANGIT